MIVLPRLVLVALDSRFKSKGLLEVENMAVNRQPQLQHAAQGRWRLSLAAAQAHASHRGQRHRAVRVTGTAITCTAPASVAGPEATRGRRDVFRRFLKAIDVNA